MTFESDVRAVTTNVMRPLLGSYWTYKMTDKLIDEIIATAAGRALLTRKLNERSV